MWHRRLSHSNLPAAESLLRAWEEATTNHTPASAEFTKDYQSLFDALLHASKFRVEILAAMGLSGSCLTFPNGEAVLMPHAHPCVLGTLKRSWGDLRDPRSRGRQAQGLLRRQLGHDALDHGLLHHARRWCGHLCLAQATSSSHPSIIGNALFDFGPTTLSSFRPCSLPKKSSFIPFHISAWNGVLLLF